MDYRALHPRVAHELALAYDLLYWYQRHCFGNVYRQRMRVARLLCKVQHKRGDIPGYSLNAKHSRDFKRKYGHWPLKLGA